MVAPASDPQLLSIEPAGMRPPAPVKTTKGATGLSTTSRKTTKPRPTAMEYPLIYVEWNDHHSSDDWIDDDDLVIRMLPMSNRSVGWLIKESDTVVVLFSCHSGCKKNPANNPYAHTQTIIKACITKYVVLQP